MTLRDIYDYSGKAVDELIGRIKDGTSILDYPIVDSFIGLILILFLLLIYGCCIWFYFYMVFDLIKGIFLHINDIKTLIKNKNYFKIIGRIFKILARALLALILISPLIITIHFFLS